MIQTQICPECGDGVPADARTKGLCPKCLLWRAVADIDATPLGQPTADTGSADRRFTAPLPDELAATFPRFEILGLLGQGGMGAVYKARQKSLDRLVALKLICGKVAQDPAFIDRFHREARTLAKLNHPNIVTAYDYGQVEDGCYIVMEYVDGVNLRQVLRDGPLTAAEVIDLAGQVCDGLSYAHELGIVHRDVKPENILLEDRGTIKIADFGLAMLVEPSPRDPAPSDRRDVLGTPYYMAPEQRQRPGETDHRADIYAMGVVLHEMLTGELPMEPFESVSQQTRVDARIDQIVLRCLAKEPDRRFQGAGEVKECLTALAGPPDHASRRNRLAKRLTIGLLSAAVVALLAWQIVIRIRGTNDQAPRIDIEASGNVDVHITQAPEPDPTKTAEGTAPKDGGSSATADPPVALQIPNGTPAVELSGAKLMGGFPHRSLRIEYRFVRGSPSPGRHFSLVIESDDLGQVTSGSLPWLNLGAQGTLRRDFWPRGYDAGPWEAYLEVRDMRPSMAGRRISNIVKLQPPTSRNTPKNNDQ